jgi:transcriptional regulator with XRE-family HTH domain
MAKSSARAVDILVGRNIRIIRLRRGLSQAALGKPLGVSLQQIQKYETGANRVGASRVVQIAQALQVPIAALFEGIPIAGQTAAPESPLRDLLTDRRALRLAQAFDQISGPATRLAIVNVVEAVAGTRMRRP